MAKKKIKKKVKKDVKYIGVIFLIIFLIATALAAGNYYLVYNKELEPITMEKEYYNLSDFGFIEEVSSTDYDGDGIDDYADILQGEKQYAKWNPTYISKYYAGGYPPVQEEGVCTDLVWYALQNAGYDLKAMISYDIHEEYDNDTYGIEIVDDNIDFRRVGPQETFFQRYAESLETDIYNIGDFMPGDIITFDDSAHIAMISDKYNKNGVPYVIQNRDETQEEKEEDRLEITEMEVTGHYRFAYNEKLENLINQMNNDNE